MSTPHKRIIWLWPLILIAGSVVLLLNNFLLIDIDIAPYWPAALVLLGLQLLVRGDIAPTWQAHTFGITRGSVQSAAIEIESGEIDVQLQALRKPGRLIAGQYTARSRPGLVVRNNRAMLSMQRGQTWWLSLADWDVGLAHDLPWEILMSSHLGRLDADLRGLAIARAYISSGLGHVTVACPEQCDQEISARSTLGDVRLSIPPRSRAIIKVNAGPFARVRYDRERFAEIEPGLLVTAHNQDDSSEQRQPDLHIIASSAFGTIQIH